MSIHEMADTCWLQLADVPEDVPVVVLGYSMGGYILQHMLAHTRRRISGSIMVSTSTRPETQRTMSSKMRSIQRILRDYHSYVGDLVDVCVDPATPDFETAVRVTRAMMLACGPIVAINQVIGIATRGDHREALACLDHAALIMCGQRDQITPVHLSRATKRLLPGSELILVEDAGHMLPLEQPAIMAEAINSYLGKTLDRVVSQ